MSSEHYDVQNLRWYIIVSYPDVDQISICCSALRWTAVYRNFKETNIIDQSATSPGVLAGKGAKRVCPATGLHVFTVVVPRSSQTVEIEVSTSFIFYFSTLLPCVTPRATLLAGFLSARRGAVLDSWRSRSRGWRRRRALWNKMAEWGNS